MARASPYLSGNFAPVEEEVTVFDLEVTGAIPPDLRGRFLRIGPNPVDPAAGKVREERIDDRGQEFPRHDERRAGRPVRFGYTAWFGDELAHGPLLKHDLAAGSTEIHDEGAGRMFMEPVFVPASDDAGEDDGWVMAYVYDATTDRSDVVVLHAREFAAAPVATIHLPQRVPFGFHGNWVPDEG